jgi:hypothetical protein
VELSFLYNKNLSSRLSEVPIPPAGMQSKMKTRDETTTCFAYL